MVVIPTRDQISTVVRQKYNPANGEKNEAFEAKIEQKTETKDGLWKMVPQMIEKRNIFESVESIRADSADEINVPEGGILIWGERLASGVFFHARADGQAEMTMLPNVYVNAVDEFDALNRMVSHLEQFAKKHPPSKSTD